MRFFLSLTSVLLFSFAGAQELNFRQYMDSGLSVYMNQYNAPTTDYSLARQLFQEAVRLEPADAEARYALGHAIDKVNASGGGKITDQDVELTLAASKQLEKVNEMQPRYFGQIFVLDPYSKLGAIWGSLALKYLYEEKQDSLLWALKEGKKRGGFNDAILEFNRQLLQSVNDKAILFTTGDNITFPVLYLQKVENFRTDVSAVDIDLTGTTWYVDHIQKQGFAKGYNDPEMDTIFYRTWKPKQQVIVNPNKPTESFKWMLKPTVYRQYIQKSDLVTLEIVKDNFFTRDFYFSGIFVDTTTNLHLGKYINLEGLVNRLYRTPVTSTTIPANYQKYTADKFNPSDIEKSPDADFLLGMIRYSYLDKAMELVKKNKPEAARLVALMDKKFPQAKFPLNEGLKEMYKDVVKKVR
jgi:hypothetical protein